MDVLLVEPEPAMSALLQSVLESRGHAVTAVADGESGWESYQSRHFSMVILEWLLPEMDGLEVCRKIRSSPKGEDSLILVITLRTNPGDLKQILAAGADDYLAQPVDRLLLNIRLEIAEQRASRLMHQRKAEKGRGQVQAMLKLVLDTIPSRVFWKNKESRYLGCNRLFALDAGLQDPSQIVGKTDRDLRWAEQAQLYISDDLAVMQSGLPKVNYEEHQTSPDGESMYLEASKIPLKDGKGNLIGVLGTYQDITERKRAETELFAAQSNLAATLDALPDLLFELGLDGRYYDYHSSRPELLAAPPEALIGKTVHDILPPEAADVVMLALREADETGHSHGRQIELQVPQGKLWFELSIARKPVAAGLAPRFIVLLRDITVRKRAEAEILALNLSLEEQVQERTKELLAKEEQLRETLALNDSILMTSPMGIAAYRQDGQCVMANPSLASIADITQEQLLKQNFRQLSSWQASGIQEAAERVLATGARVELEIRHLTSFFGHDVWARCWLSRFTSRGEPHLLLMLENITEKKAAEEELRLAASVYQNSSEGILVTDAAGIILSVNPAFTEITGYAEDEALGRKTSLLRSDRHGPEFYRSMWEALTKEGCWRGEVWNRRKDGEAYLEWLSINRIEASAGAPIRYVAVFHDITELRRKDEEIRHQAFHDALTGLPNRALMKDRLLHALERAKREGGRLAVIFIDLDRFKAINDGLGHDVGDLLLQEVARRIKSRMRTADTVARLGGDEFVVLMEDLQEAGDCASLAQELMAEIARPMELSGHAVEIRASMGMAFYPEDGTNPMELMKRADLAMYSAKAAGRNTYRFFQQDMQDRISQRLNLEMELRLALAQRDLELHYQPKVDLATGKILGVEALVRWRHPLRGLLLPADFIPLAEECGLICALGDWVLDEICRQSAVWQAAGHTFKIAFNISPHQLEMGDLVARISELAAHHGIAPSDLEIELTESAVMAYSIHAASVLARLRGIGVTVAVSDFCAGYSSLSYLRKLPIDILKINHSFVTDADSNAEDAQIVKTILALGRMFKLTMEAEGIETSHQAELLQSFGCGIAQGYFFSRPLPAREFEDWLDAAIAASGSRPSLE
ncbi:MAG: EAL domain-containing protein [Sulfuricella sp.]